MDNEETIVLGKANVKIKYTRQRVDDNLLMKDSNMEAYEINGTKGYRAKPSTLSNLSVEERTVQFVGCGTSWGDVARKLGLPLFETVELTEEIHGVQYDRIVVDEIAEPA